LLITLAVGVSGAIIVWLFRMPRSQCAAGRRPLAQCGGRIGNVIDRIRLGMSSISFTSLGYGRIFLLSNRRGFAITVRAALLLLDALLEPKRAKVKA